MPKNSHKRYNTPMNRQETLKTLSDHLTELEEKFGIKTLSLFGSVARNEATQTSDIDLVVDYGKAPTFRQYTDALLYLEDLLGCKVDLITKGSLKPDLAPHINQDLQPINHAS